MKRALAVSGFTMLGTLLVFCKIHNDTVMSVAIIASLIFSLLFTIIKPTRRNRTLPVAALSMFVALVLLFFSNSMYFKNAVLYADKEVTVTGTLSALPYKSNGNSYYIIDTDFVNGQQEHLSLRLSCDSPLDLEPTDIVTVKVKTFLLGTNDDDYLDYYKSKDLTLGAYPLGDAVIDKGADTSLSSLLLKLRSNMINEIVSLMPNDCGGIITGMVLGDKSNMSSKATNAFAACGISHLFVVSGIHISIWSMLFYRFAKKLRFSKKSASIISILFCIFFMILTGCNPPVVRAGFMMIVIYLSNLFSREADAFNSIGLSLIVMLAINPYSALSISLWLSLLATIGILVLEKPIENILIRPFIKIKNKRVLSLSRKIITAVSVSIAVTILTIPVYLLKLKSISTILIISNIVIVYLGTFCMELGGIAALLLVIGAKFIGKPLLFLSGLISKLILFLAMWFSKFRYALVPVYSNYSKLLLAFFALIIALMLIINIRNKKIIKVIALTMVSLFVCVNAAVYTLNYNCLNMSVADVGNGMAVVIVHKGRTAIIGCGGDYFAESAICDIMKSYGVTTVDYIILPERTSSCTSAADDIIGAYNVTNLLVCDEEQTREYNFNGNIGIIDHNIIKLTDEVTLAVESESGVKAVQIIYGNFKADISLSESNTLNNASGNILVCRGKMPNGTTANKYNMVVVSDDNCDDIWQTDYARNICATIDNGSVSFSINPDGNFKEWRAY